MQASDAVMFIIIKICTCNFISGNSVGQMISSSFQNPLQLGICGHCGHSSADFAFCDSCGRQMPSGPKLSSSNSINKKTKVNVEESSHTSIDKNLFYGESSAAVDPRLLIDRTSPQNVLLEKAGKRGGRGGRRGRGKSSPYRIIKMVKNPHEPGTILLIVPCIDELYI